MNTGTVVVDQMGNVHRSPFSETETKLREVSREINTRRRELTRLTKLVQSIRNNGAYLPTKKITDKMTLLGKEMEPLLEDQRLFAETIKVKNL